MYKLLNHGILRISDQACIPPVPANSDFAEYQKWLAAGNTPEPLDPPSPAEWNAPILAQIADWESKQSRAVRDFILNGDKSRIQLIDDAIATLRTKLIK